MFEKNIGIEENMDVVEQKGYVPCFLQNKNTYAWFDTESVMWVVIRRRMHVSAAVAVTQVS